MHVILDENEYKEMKLTEKYNEIRKEFEKKIIEYIRGKIPEGELASGFIITDLHKIIDDHERNLKEAEQ